MKNMDTSTICICQSSSTAKVSIYGSLTLCSNVDLEYTENLFSFPYVPHAMPLHVTSHVEIQEHLCDFTCFLEPPFHLYLYVLILHRICGCGTRQRKISGLRLRSSLLETNLQLFALLRGR